MIWITDLLYTKLPVDQRCRAIKQTNKQNMTLTYFISAPYGIREGAKKVGTDKDEIGPIGGQR